jgi:hypothetical protein
MPAFEVAEAPVALLRQVVGAADTAHALAPLDAIQQHIEHGRRGLADGDDEDALVGAQVDVFGAAAVGQQAMKDVSCRFSSAKSLTGVMRAAP